MKHQSTVIHIIGLGVSHCAQLSKEARMALQQSDWVIGSERQMEVVKRYLHTQHPMVLPALPELEKQLDELMQQPDKTIAVLASGDSLYYGIGRWLVQRYSKNCLRFYPAVSSIQAACHRLGIAQEDIEVVSLHGRPVESIRRYLKNDCILLILTDKHSSPQRLAQECQEAGFCDAQLTICQALGYPNERIDQYRVNELIECERGFDPLHVTLIETGRSVGYRPEFPGFPDELFHTEDISDTVMITKREVRLNVLSLIAPANHDVIWDIGAGCGSVSVELAFWNKRCKVFAIEQHPERIKSLDTNRKRFGVLKNLTPVAGRAPGILDELPPPDKVFIGGSDGELGDLLTTVWAALQKGGVLVASAVTEPTKHQLQHFAQKTVGEPETCHSVITTQIAVSRGSQLGKQLLYRPALPVTLFRFEKGSG